LDIERSILDIPFYLSAISIQSPFLFPFIFRPPITVPLPFSAFAFPLLSTHPTLSLDNRSFLLQGLEEQHPHPKFNSSSKSTQQLNP